MQHDPLAAFRPKHGNVPKPQAPISPPPVETYVAFSEKDGVDRLEITVSDRLARTPRYFDLVDVVFDGKAGTRIVLTYYTMMVVITGRNLQPLVRALQRHVAEAVRPYDAGKWPTPPENAPLIDAIEIRHYPGGADFAAELMSGGAEAQPSAS